MHSLQVWMMANISFEQEPKKAIEYISKKYPELHFNYDDIIEEAHHKAFTVAKITRLDLLKDVLNSLVKANEEGLPFEAWQKSLIPTLKKKGWWGNVTVTDPKTKEKKEIYVGSRRLKNIFFTNTRVAYNVGRWEHQRQLDDAPYLRYVSQLKPTSRYNHAKMHNIIRHRDDPFWINNYPLNGWNCVCTVQAVSMDTIKKRGWEERLKAPVEDIASKDWAYDIRAGGTKELDKLAVKKEKQFKKLVDKGLE